MPCWCARSAAWWRVTGWSEAGMRATLAGSSALADPPLGVGHARSPGASRSVENMGPHLLSSAPALDPSPGFHPPGARAARFHAPPGLILLPRAQWLRRIHFINALKGPRCSDAMAALALNSDPAVIAEILHHLTLALRPTRACNNSLPSGALRLAGTWLLPACPGKTRTEVLVRSPRRHPVAPAYPTG